MVDQQEVEARILERAVFGVQQRRRVAEHLSENGLLDAAGQLCPWLPASYDVRGKRSCRFGPERGDEHLFVVPGQVG